MSAKIGLNKFNEIINGNRPFTYEMVLAPMSQALWTRHTIRISFSARATSAQRSAMAVPRSASISATALATGAIRCSIPRLTPHSMKPFTTVTGTYSPETAAPHHGANLQPICVAQRWQREAVGLRSLVGSAGPGKRAEPVPATIPATSAAELPRSIAEIESSRTDARASAGRSVTPERTCAAPVSTQTPALTPQDSVPPMLRR